MKKSRVTATAMPYGLGAPSTDEYSGVRESEEGDVPPVEHVGEAVHEAVEKAWKAGHDPALSPFVVLVKFENVEAAPEAPVKFNG